jgi:hypothetical protein
VGPRAGLDGCGKISLSPGFDPRTVQPVAIRYTDYAIPMHVIYRLDVSFSNCIMLDVTSRFRYNISCYLEVSSGTSVMFVSYF